MMTPSVFTTKTFWSGVVTFLVTMAALFGLDLELSAEQQASIVGVMMLISGTCVRLITKREVSLLGEK